MFDTALLVFGIDEGMVFAIKLDLAALFMSAPQRVTERATPRFDRIAAER